MVPSAFGTSRTNRRHQVLSLIGPTTDKGGFWPGDGLSANDPKRTLAASAPSMNKCRVRQERSPGSNSEIQSGVLRSGGWYRSTRNKFNACSFDGTPYKNM